MAVPRHQPVSRREVLLAGAALGASSALAQPGEMPAGVVERLDPALDRLIDPGVRAEIVMTGFTWSEGPVWIGGGDGVLLVSDPQANLIRSFSDRQGDAVWLRPSGYAGGDTARYREPGSNGLALGRGGLLVADSGNRRITRLDLATRAGSSVADRFEGKRFNSPNDLCVSPRDGSIYFTDPPYGLKGVRASPDREMDYTGVFHVAPDGTVALIGKYDMPNGIGLSPDGRTLYHTDGTIGWVAHQLDARGHSIGERQFIDLAAQQMTASGDGLKVDRAGNLWAASRDGISIISPAGKRLGIIRGENPLSNCAFAADGCLYLTNNHRIIRLKIRATA